MMPFPAPVPVLAALSSQGPLAIALVVPRFMCVLYTVAYSSGGYTMKFTAFVVLGLAALSFAASAQVPTDPIEKALLAAPRNLKEGATVIRLEVRLHLRNLKERHQQTCVLRPLRSAWPTAVCRRMHEYCQP